MILNWNSFLQATAQYLLQHAVSPARKELGYCCFCSVLCQVLKQLWNGVTRLPDSLSTINSLACGSAFQTEALYLTPLPWQSPPPQGGGGGRHFHIASGNGWLCCALLYFLCTGPLSELISRVIQTQMYATGTRVWYHPRRKGGPLSPFLYLTSDVCKHDQTPEQLKVPIKSQQAKPAATRAGNRVRDSLLTIKSFACGILHISALHPKQIVTNCALMTNLPERHPHPTLIV